MSVNSDVEELIGFLESKDCEIVQHFKNVVQEKLYTSADQNLLGTLMDRYIQTKAEVLLDLLIGVNDILAMYLFDRMNDHLKHGSCIDVCTILFSIVKKQPSWLHKIIGTSLFATFLKHLRTDQDLVFIMHGILILCSLIPCVPAIIGSHISEVFEVFVRTASILVNKAAAIPEVCALHLNVGIYIFFHRLYTMYPNNFLKEMRRYYAGNGKNEPVFQEVIKPMFEFVKFHPDLITDTIKSEIALEKWKVYQPHDVLVECQKISLDQLDMVKEAKYAVYDSQLEDVQRFPSHVEDGVSLSKLNSYFTHPDSTNHMKNLKEEESEDEPEVGKEPLNASLCNPSEICGLSTPPSLTRSNSTQDISSLQSRKNDDSDSNQTLNEVPEKLIRSSTGTFSNTSGQSPASKRGIVKTKSFGSGDTFSNKSIFRSVMSSNTYHSTPVDRKHLQSNTSLPASPRKANSQGKRPQSSEFIRNNKKDLFKPLELDCISDSYSVQSNLVQSAPSSPMVPVNPSLFSFNVDNLEPDGKFNSQDELNNAKENIKRLNILPCHSFSHDSNLKDISSHQSSNPLTFLKSIREMFLELLPNPTTKGCESVVDQMESSLSSSCNFKKRSPLNLLDDFIQYGSDIHSYHLSRVPLTSQLDTDWTYYGGSSPVDELKILQTQVQLLNIQLQYERYKCELHCLRNRRLFGSVQKVQKSRNEVDTLKNQILLADSKLQEMKLALRFKCEENRQIKQQSSHREEEYMTKICKYEEENNKLEFKLKNHKLKKKEERKKVSSLEDELHRVKYLLFDATQKYNHIKSKYSQLGYYQTVTTSMEKELLLQYEKQERLKIQVDQSQHKLAQHVDHENKIASLKHEVSTLQDEKQALHMHVELLKLKRNELESSNSKKDSLIVEQKAHNKKLHLKHKTEIEAVESRFQSSLKTSQSLQSYITSLYAKLDPEPRSCQNLINTQHSVASHGPGHSTKCVERCRKVSYSGPGSPRPLSMHDHSHRHSIHSSENPFRSRKQSSQSNKSSIADEPSKEDSGIGESTDMLNVNDSNS